MSELKGNTVNRTCKSLNKKSLENASTFPLRQVKIGKVSFNNQTYFVIFSSWIPFSWVSFLILCSSATSIAISLPFFSASSMYIGNYIIIYLFLILCSSATSIVISLPSFGRWRREEWSCSKPFRFRISIHHCNRFPRKWSRDWRRSGCRKREGYHGVSLEAVWWGRSYLINLLDTSLNNRRICQTYSE